MWFLGDRGSRIALLGLLANIGLTGVKGVSGWYYFIQSAPFCLVDVSCIIRYLNSAALLADAAHSLSGELSSTLHPFFADNESLQISWVTLSLSFAIVSPGGRLPQHTHTDLANSRHSVRQ